MAFPSVITTFTNPNATDRLNSPSHSSIETAQNNALTAIMNAVGTDASTLGTIIGDLRNTTSGGGGHIQTANKGGTGQTTFTKGDLLIAQSSSVISKLAVGSDNSFLVADSTQQTGIKWATTLGSPTVRTYTTPSIIVWNKPSTLSYLVIETIGAGGNGGIGAANSSGGGGGGGGYSKKIMSAATLSTVELLMVGSVITGSVAGRSSFGLTSYLSASGGSPATAANAGGGGVGSGGDVNIGGGGGSAGATLAAGSPGSGSGGNSFYGGGGAGVQNAAGIAGNNYGSGGSGGSGAGNGGGGGVNGIVVVYEY